MRFKKASIVIDELQREEWGELEREMLVVRAASRSNAATTLREIFRESGDMDHATESATCFKTSIEDLEESVGRDHIRISKTLRDFSVLLEMVEDHEGVEAALRRALTIHAHWGLQQDTDQEPARAATERTQMIVPLASACKAQGKMEEVEELEDPFFKCVEVAMTSSRSDDMESALECARSFMDVAGKEKSEVDFALQLLRGLKKDLDLGDKEAKAD